MTITPASGISASVAVQKAVSSVAFAVGTATQTAGAAKTGNASSIAILPGSSKLFASSGLYDTSLGLAQTNAEVETSGNSVQQILSSLQSLASIAQQVSDGDAGASSGSSLQNQFQNLYQKIDQIAAGTSFGGKKMLTGSFVINSNGMGGNFSDQENYGFAIPDLSTGGLFGDNVPVVSTPVQAKSAVAQINSAFAQVENVSGNLENIGVQLSAAAAVVGSAQSNQYAASSTLSDNDLGESGFTGLLFLLSSSPDVAASIQAAKLSGSISGLLG